MTLKRQVSITNVFHSPNFITNHKLTVQKVGNSNTRADQKILEKQFSDKKIAYRLSKNT